MAGHSTACTEMIRNIQWQQRRCEWATGSDHTRPNSRLDAADRAAQDDDRACAGAPGGAQVAKRCRFADGCTGVTVSGAPTHMVLHGFLGTLTMCVAGCAYSPPDSVAAAAPGDGTAANVDAAPDSPQIGICTVGLPQPGTQVYDGKDIPEIAVSWPDGGWALAGQRVISGDTRQAWVERHKPDGSVAWTKGWQAGQLAGVTVAVAVADDVVVATQLAAVSGHKSAFSVYRLGSNGKEAWSRKTLTFGGIERAVGTIKAIAPLGGDRLVVAAGVRNGMPLYSEEGALIAIDASDGATILVAITRARLRSGRRPGARRFCHLERLGAPKRGLGRPRHSSIQRGWRGRLAVGTTVLGWVSRVGRRCRWCVGVW